MKYDEYKMLESRDHHNHPYYCKYRNQSTNNTVVSWFHKNEGSSLSNWLVKKTAAINRCQARALLSKTLKYMTF